MKHQIDLKRFSEAVIADRLKKRYSLRDVTAETNISAPTISRIERANLPDLDTYIVLCKWLNRSPLDFVNNLEVKQSVINSRYDVIDFLRADRRLDTRMVDAITTMIDSAYSQIR